MPTKPPGTPPSQQELADARLQAHDFEAYRRLVHVNRPKVRAIRMKRNAMIDGHSVKAGEILLVLPTTPPPGTVSANVAAVALEDGFAEPLTEEQLAELDSAATETGSEVPQ